MINEGNNGYSGKGTPSIDSDQNKMQQEKG